MVANELGFNYKTAAQTLKTYLYCITILMNLCAHESRIYNHLFITKPSQNKKESALLRDDPNGGKDNAHIFGYILNIKRFVDKNTFSRFINSLIDLTKKYPFVEMRYYGFCDNWQNVL